MEIDNDSLGASLHFALLLKKLDFLFKLFFGGFACNPAKVEEQVRLLPRTPEKSSMALRNCNMVKCSVVAGRFFDIRIAAVIES